MEDQSTLFSKGDENNQNQNPTGESSVVTLLVGEGKKFKTVDDLAKGKLEADQFIEKLKSEIKQKDEQLAKAATLDEVLLTMQNNTINDQNSTSKQDNDTGLNDEARLAQIVQGLLQKEKEKFAVEQNLKEVREFLVKSFGDEYEASLIEKAKELQVSKEYLDNVAQTAPQVFMRLVGNTQPNTTNERVNSNATIFPTTNTRGSNQYTPRIERQPTTVAEAVAASKDTIFNKQGQLDPKGIHQLMQQLGLA